MTSLLLGYPSPATARGRGCQLRPTFPVLPPPQPPDLSDFSLGSSSVLISPPLALAGSVAAKQKHTSTWEGDRRPGDPLEGSPLPGRTMELGLMHMGSIPVPLLPAAASRPQLVKAAATTMMEMPFKL